MRRVLLGCILAVAAVSQASAFDAKLLDPTYGGAMRLRHEFWKNWKDMDNGQLDNRNFFRVKTSLWGQLAYGKKADIYAKLTNEFKAYTYWAGSGTDKSANKKGYYFDINEVVFDNLYADLKEVATLPVDLRVGRQDLLNMYGENFLIADGTPSDGSRTFYFNAAKASWRANEHNTVDFIYINDPRDEDFLPVINRTRLVNYSNRSLDKVSQPLNASDEQGFVLYLKNKYFKHLPMEWYYIYKKESEEGGAGYQAQASEINTVGTFMKYLHNNWTLRGQLAGQAGTSGANEREAVGGYAFLDRDFPSLAWKPKATAGYVYLSGDKRSTNRVEGWDPLFSRFPWYSELYNLSMASETGIAAYWTNMQMYRTGLEITPTKKTKCTFNYTFMRANAQVAASGIFTGEGRNRGHLLQGKVDYAVNKNITTYFMVDYLVPGNFYKDRDNAIFLRTEVSLKF